MDRMRVEIELLGVECVVWAELLPNRLGLGPGLSGELESLWLIWIVPQRRLKARSVLR